MENKKRTAVSLKPSFRLKGGMFPSVPLSPSPIEAILVEAKRGSDTDITSFSFDPKKDEYNNALLKGYSNYPLRVITNRTYLRLFSVRCWWKVEKCV